MKKLLLLLTLVLGIMPVYSQNIESVTETFGSWFRPSLKPSNANVVTNTSEATGITYTSSYTYWNNGGSAILIAYSDNTKGYISFTLPFDVSKITIYSGQQTASGAKIDFIAGETTLSGALALGKNGTYPIDIPGSLQASGTVYKIAIPSNVSKNAQIAKIEYTKVGNVGPVELGALSATCEGQAVGSTLEVYEGEPIVFHADNATSIEVVPENIGELTFDAATSSATLIPARCDNVKVSAVAKLEVEGEEAKVSDPLEFDLTVKKADYVIADWVVTGITQTSGGSELDNPLICSESSAAGTWQANHATAYSATNKGCAQLGSATVANTFNGGTLTLSKSDIPTDATILSVSMTGYNSNSTHAVWTVSVDEVEAESKITFGNSSATNTANVNLVGNKIVLTCNASTANGNIKQVYLSGISVKYVLPEEQPGEIALDYTKQFCLECDETGTELTVMDGTELTFSSFAAARMEITTEDEGVELPSAVNEANISWTVPEGTIATIRVKATSENGTKFSEKTYTVASETVVPEVPEYLFETDSKTVMVSTASGALMIKAEPYVDGGGENVAPMSIVAQDWAFTAGDNPKDYEFSYADMSEVMSVSAKSVTPLAESEAVQFFVNDNGQVSGVENVAIDSEANEVVYYNLQGQRVEADRPGLYVRLVSGKAEKVVVR